VQAVLAQIPEPAAAAMLLMGSTLLMSLVRRPRRLHAARESGFGEGEGRELFSLPR
jgi:hypothetical protein